MVFLLENLDLFDDDFDDETEDETDVSSTSMEFLLYLSDMIYQDYSVLEI